MGRSHFADYMKNDRDGYQTFSDNLWNGFVSVTKAIPVVSRFFSFTPDFPAPRLGQESGSFTVQELENLNPRNIGRELGKVYKNTISDDKPL
jgi:hypothetical protein